MKPKTGVMLTRLGQSIRGVLGSVRVISTTLGNQCQCGVPHESIDRKCKARLMIQQNLRRPLKPLAQTACDY